MQFYQRKTVLALQGIINGQNNRYAFTALKHPTPKLLYKWA
jgi:hypothetical protein